MTGNSTLASRITLSYDSRQLSTRVIRVGGDGEFTYLPLNMTHYLSRFEGTRCQVDPWSMHSSRWETTVHNGTTYKQENDCVPFLAPPSAVFSTHSGLADCVPEKFPVFDPLMVFTTKSSTEPQLPSAQSLPPLAQTPKPTNTHGVILAPATRSFTLPIASPSKLAIKHDTVDGTPSSDHALESTLSENIPPVDPLIPTPTVITIDHLPYPISVRPQSRSAPAAIIVGEHIIRQGSPATTVAGEVILFDTSGDLIVGGFTVTIPKAVSSTTPLPISNPAFDSVAAFGNTLPADTQLSSDGPVCAGVSC